MNQKSRVVFMLLMLAYLVGVVLSQNNLSDLVKPDHYYTVLVTYTFTIILVGSFLLEPYFTKPVDLISRGLGTVVLLVSYSGSMIMKEYILVYLIVLTIFAFIVILIKHKSKAITLLWKFIEFIGNSKIMISIVYFSVILAEFQSTNDVEFRLFTGFWLMFIFHDSLYKYFIRFVDLYRTKTVQDYGMINYSISTYMVECELKNMYKKKSQIGNLVLISKSKTQYYIGMVVNEKTVLDKKIVVVVTIMNNKKIVVYNSSESAFIEENEWKFTEDSRLLLLGTEIGELFKQQYSEVLEKYNRIIGYIINGTDINIARVESFDYYNGIAEGDILTSDIGYENVLYQVINGETRRTSEGMGDYGYIQLSMRKLGQYKEGKLKDIEWLPNMYTPVFKDVLNKEHPYEPKKFIGVLPKTNMGVEISRPNDIVTHNTAILGILGVGKSRLAYELVQKVYGSTNVKFIVIDLSNQYEIDLKNYIDRKQFYKCTCIPTDIITDFSNNVKKTGNDRRPSEWGNIKEYKYIMKTCIEDFIINSDERVYVFNPDKMAVTKAMTNFNITENIEITAAEKTRIITEFIYETCRTNGETEEAKVCIVFDEAHSLIPEFNSAASKSDANSSNGTSRVILQGRKYGLGSIVITQRTANISKSVLNQCNTIFSLRMFDDTGKSFLNNYFGAEYSALLPTLKERFAIVFGKGLSLIQPVMLKLNDMDKVMIDQTADQDET